MWEQTSRIKKTEKNLWIIRIKPFCFHAAAVVVAFKSSVKYLIAMLFFVMVWDRGGKTERTALTHFKQYQSKLQDWVSVGDKTVQYINQNVFLII